MTRLPQPGGDGGVWGDILNDFLKVELNNDGTLKKAGDIADAKSKADAAVQSVNGKTGQNVSLALDDLSDVITSSPGNGQGITYNGSSWALTDLLPASQKGAANGVASLDSGGKLPNGQLPTVVAGLDARVQSVEGSSGESVMAHGAVGDSSTDDSAAFQAAINTVRARGGGTVSVPGGKVYMVTDLVLDDGVSLIGQGWTTTLRNLPGVSTPVVRTPEVTGDQLTVAANACLVSNLRIDGNARNGATGDGIRFEEGTETGPQNIVWGGPTPNPADEQWGAHNHRIENCFVMDVGGNGIIMGKRSGGLVRGCFVLWCRKAGVVLRWYDQIASDLHITGCGDGIRIEANQCLISNCKPNYSFGNAPAGTPLNGPNSPAFVGNGDGIICVGSNQLITGCEGQNNYAYGVRINSSNGNRITGFISQGDKLAPVYIGGTSVDNKVDVAATGGGDAGTPVGVIFDGASVQRNEVILHATASGKAGGFSRVSALNSADLRKNRLSGGAFLDDFQLTPASPWTLGFGSPGVFCSREGSVGRIRGVVTGGTTQTIITLPDWCRPAQDRLVLVYAITSGFVTTLSAINIASATGVVTRNTGPAADGFIWLDCVFPL